MRVELFPDLEPGLSLFEDHPAVAAELSGYAGKFRCFLERKYCLFRFILFLKQALKQTRSLCLRAF
jgi:hypothetical protein